MAEASGTRALAHKSAEAESISVSSAPIAKAHEAGKLEASVPWFKSALAFKSKGSKSATCARGLASAFKRCAPIVAFKLNAERRAASRAVTGLIQPCSSVDISAVVPAPVKASGPVQRRCCREGWRGKRRKFRLSPSADSGVEGALLAIARFSNWGKAAAVGVARPKRVARV